MIGTLLYLTASRPGISFSVGVCAQFQSQHREQHAKVVKRIIRYISEITDFGLWYTKDTTTYLARYCDADWDESSDDQKSTIGGCFYVGNNLVSWFTKKKISISLSATEAEYIIARSCCA